MADNFPKLITNTETQIQEVAEILSNEVNAAPSNIK